MPITPTSTLSKNYQALGIDEIANDIETAFTSINATDDALVVLEAQVQAIPGADATTVTVDITSAQILAGGSIELLPTPGVGMYYDLGDYFLEPIEATTDYTVTGFARMYCGGDLVSFNPAILNAVGVSLSAVCGNLKSPSLVAVTIPYNEPVTVNSPLSMYFDTTPTLGNHGLRAIITYTVRTFGA